MTPTPAQAATTVLIKRDRHGNAYTIRGLDTVDDLQDTGPLVRHPSAHRTLRSLDTSSALKRAIRSALLDLGTGTSRELVAKALWAALTDHERKHPSPI